MKKVLSLILVFLMLVAMAVPAVADDDIAQPYDLDLTEKSEKRLGDDYQMLPGETYYIEMINTAQKTLNIDKRDFRIEFDITKGEKHVAAHGLEDGEFYITVANNHSLTVDDPGYIEFDITITAKDDWTTRGITKNEKFTYSGAFDVGNDVYYVDTYEDAEDAEIYDGTGSAISFAADDRGWVIFDCGAIDIQMRLGSRAIAFDPDESKIAAIDKLAKNSVPKCVNFLAQPKISGTATFMVDDDYDYVYAFDGNKLTRIEVKEDGRYNTWKMSDVTLGTFVLSTESLAGSVAQSSQPEAPAPESSAAPAPAPESSAAPAPAPESSVTEPVEEPEEPEEEPTVDITPEPEVEPAPETSAEEEEPVEAPVEEEEEPTKSLLPVILMILAAAIVVAILIALLVARSGKKSRR